MQDGFARRERESASDRKARAAARPPRSPVAPPPAPAIPPDDDDDGGFEDFHALQKQHRARDKHGHNHGVAAARGMAVAKRAGQRAAAAARSPNGG